MAEAYSDIWRWEKNLPFLHTPNRVSFILGGKGASVAVPGFFRIQIQVLHLRFGFGAWFFFKITFPQKQTFSKFDETCFDVAIYGQVIIAWDIN